MKDLKPLDGAPVLLTGREILGRGFEGGPLQRRFRPLAKDVSRPHRAQIGDELGQLPITDAHPVKIDDGQILPP